MKREIEKKESAETTQLISDLAKKASEAVRKGPEGGGQVAEAIRAFQNERRLSKEELKRAATI